MQLFESLFHDHNFIFRIYNFLDLKIINSDFSDVSFWGTYG